MKKAFEQNVSRARPRLRLGSMTSDAVSEPSPESPEPVAPAAPRARVDAPVPHSTTQQPEPMPEARSQEARASAEPAPSRKRTTSSASEAVRTAASPKAPKNPEVQPPVVQPQYAQPVAQDPVAQQQYAQPVAQQPAAQPQYAQPVAQAPVAQQQYAQPVAQAPVAQPQYAQPAAEPPVAQQQYAQPVAQAPVAQPQYAQPVAQAPVAQQQYAEPVAQQAYAAQQYAAEQEALYAAQQAAAYAHAATFASPPEHLAAPTYGWPVPGAADHHASTQVPAPTLTGYTQAYAPTPMNPQAAFAPPQVPVEVQHPTPPMDERDSGVRRERLKERLKAVRENPRPEPLPPTVAEAGMLAVGRISTLQAELAEVKAMNTALSQDLDTTRRLAEKATEEARLRTEESRRLTAEMDGRIKLLGELERELGALEGERDESLLALQETRLAVQSQSSVTQTLQAEIAKRDQALADSLAEEERLADELEAAQDESLLLRRTVDALTQERALLARQVSELTTERTELLEARKALESVHRALTNATRR